MSREIVCFGVLEFSVSTKRILIGVFIEIVSTMYTLNIRRILYVDSSKRMGK